MQSKLMMMYLLKLFTSARLKLLFACMYVQRKLADFISIVETRALELGFSSDDKFSLSYAKSVKAILYVNYFHHFL